MAAPKEIELKLEVPPAGLPALGKLPFFQTLKSPIETENEISVYFDTDNQKLRKHGLMLRVRRIGKRRVQTIKATGETISIRRDKPRVIVPLPLCD